MDSSTTSQRTLAPDPFLELLTEHQSSWLARMQADLALSFQSRHKIATILRDLHMWAEGEKIEQIFSYGSSLAAGGAGKPGGKKLLAYCSELSTMLVNAAKQYAPTPLQEPNRPKLSVVTEQTDRKIFGRCPVASEKTVCCNLLTIDAVENCSFGCSYCTIQTFYGDSIRFDAQLAQKLEAVGKTLEPDRFYHIGTGQSSDSLVWGNRNNVLAVLCQFARNNPNVLLEFKTKSHNVRWFLQNPPPANIVCSWSLNAPTIIDNEEHFTASLDARLAAARQVADRGIAVAFHFHPIVWFDGWQQQYREVVQRVLSMFSPHEVLSISMGSVTFIKPVIAQIRKRGEQSKILQMQMVKDPHGKLTYPAPVKRQTFSLLYEAFKPWHADVFFYLCMEHAQFWNALFGWHYTTNESFEKHFLHNCMTKISHLHNAQIR